MRRRVVSPVEWLLCLAIIVVGACAFKPLQSHTGGPGPAKTCLSHVKQVATGMIIYLGDYDDKLPPPARWMDSEKPYTKNEALYHCPSVAPQSYGYAYNSAIAGHNATSIPNPAEAPLIFDSSRMQRSASATIKTLPSPARHEGKNNIAYSDSHARAIANKSRS